MIEDRHSNFLLDVHAGNVRHSGRTLYEHLCGTHDLLREWGCSDDVCVAGLFHSLYGTRPFKHESWPLKDREIIRDLIGEHAERLVYLFCVIDRPLAIVRGYDLKFPISKELRELREIEAANLIEQASSGVHLRTLAEVVGLSPIIKIAIEKHLEGKHHGHAGRDGRQRRIAGR